jgi:hypothetical protein
MKLYHPKSITKNQRLRAGYNHVHTPPGFPPDYFDNFPLLKLRVLCSSMEYIADIPA